MALSLGQFINVGGMVKDLKSFNFSVYGRWFGYINIILCIALGIANLFHVSGVIAFGIISIIQGLVILFIEIPFLLKICPLSDNFIEFIKRFETNGWRCLFLSSNGDNPVYFHCSDGYESNCGSCRANDIVNQLCGSIY